jgi:molybdopterin molybdotransferase
VSVLATGDELAAIGGALAPGHLWDSNSHVLEALAVACGANVVRRETVGDEPASIRRAIIAAAGSDVLVLSGGVSRGAHDHVRPSLEALGASQRFWGIGIRPGAPTWFGVLDGTLVFALPGNPVAAITSFTLLVAPALAALQGLMPPSHKLTARLDDGYEKPPGCAHAVPCRVALRSDGLHACATRAQGPNGLSTMLNADAIAVIPSAVARGGEVAVEPLPASCLSA